MIDLVYDHRAGQLTVLIRRSECLDAGLGLSSGGGDGDICFSYGSERFGVGEDDASDALKIVAEIRRRLWCEV